MRAGGGGGGGGDGRKMAALKEARSYGLACGRPGAGPRLSLLHVKLTDSALRAFESYRACQVSARGRQPARSGSRPLPGLTWHLAGALPGAPGSPAGAGEPDPGAGASLAGAGPPGFGLSGSRAAPGGPRASGGSAPGSRTRALRPGVPAPGGQRRPASPHPGETAPGLSRGPRAGAGLCLSRVGAGPAGAL